MDIRKRFDSSQPSLLTNGLLGVAQILIWGGSFFLMAILANPVTKTTNWPNQWVYGSLSISMLLSGFLAPYVGRLIARQYTNTLLRYSGFVVGLGLLIVAISPALWIFIVGWCIIGVGMAMGLYDALFAVLGKHYGLQAKQSITQITLISGFCTTVIWPLLAWLIDEWGWRIACAGYGLLLWLTIWPLYYVALPEQTDWKSTLPVVEKQKNVAGDGTMFGLLAVNFTIAATIMTAISVQLIDVLQAKGVTLATAISIGALIGPCQVGVRALDLVTPKKHPIWTTLISSVLTLAGLVLLGLNPVLAGMGVVLYSLGNGMRSILRGTLPLELFGPASYSIVLGRLARPALLAQAVTPLLGAYLLHQYGALTLLSVLTGLAFLNIGLTVAIKWRMHKLESISETPKTLATTLPF